MQSIYRLKDPRDYLIRYVGKTKNIKQREMSHFSYNGRSKKDAWVDGLRDEGLRPILETIEEVEDNQAKGRESYWIYFYLDEGFPLLNDLEAIERAYRRK